MSINYIFSGYGHAVGDYAVTNNDLYRAAQNGQLKGFNEDLILQSKTILSIKEQSQCKSVRLFVGHKMALQATPRCTVASHKGKSCRGTNNTRFACQCR